jgi:tRNA(Arg) A34 adenosine deaminase TadA
MPKRIAISIEESIAADYRSGKLSERQIAKRNRVARGTVRSVIHFASWRNRRGRVTKGSPEGALIDFCCVPQYLCGGCERMVTIEPCPVCVALAAHKRKHGIGSA